VWFGVVVLLSLMLTASAGESVRVTTTDGRVISGELRTSKTSKTLLIRSAVRDIYLSSRIVKTIDRAAPVGEMPAYELAENLRLVRAIPKKGTIGPVIKEYKAGRFDEEGLAAASFAITRITPRTYEFQGVEYRHKLAFPCSFPNSFWKKMVFRRVNFKDAKSLVKAIGFFTQAGDDATVRELIGALENISPQAAGEQRGIAAANAVRKALRQAERLEFSTPGPLSSKTSPRLLPRPRRYSQPPLWPGRNPLSSGPDEWSKRRRWALWGTSRSQSTTCS